MAPERSCPINSSISFFRLASRNRWITAKSFRLVGATIVVTFSQISRPSLPIRQKIVGATQLAPPGQGTALAAFLTGQATRRILSPQDLVARSPQSFLRPKSEDLSAAEFHKMIFRPPSAAITPSAVFPIHSHVSGMAGPFDMLEVAGATFASNSYRSKSRSNSRRKPLPLFIQAGTSDL